MSSLCDIKQLTVNYITDQGRVKALDEVNLTIERGTVRGLVGESGCGKSTLAKSILRILPSSAQIDEKSQILFQGEDMLKKPEKELNAMRGGKLTLIPQNPSDSLNPVFTIGTQMWDIVVPKLFPSRDYLGKRKKRRQEIARLFVNELKRVQLPSARMLLNRYPHELSGGQKQRILIAIALLTNPVLLVADEPTTALDVTVEAQIIQLLEILIKEHRTSTLYITHDLSVASKVCDLITVMYCGQIVESAPSISFFSNPAHPYSRKLLECLPKPDSELGEIPGRVPSLISPPEGCSFHPRCDRNLAQCSKKKPPRKEVTPAHWVCCYNPFLERNTKLSKKVVAND